MLVLSIAFVSHFSLDLLGYLAPSSGPCRPLGPGAHKLVSFFQEEDSAGRRVDHDGGLTDGGQVVCSLASGWEELGGTPRN